MIALLSGFASKAWAWIAGIGAILAAAAGAFLIVKNEGEADQKFTDDQATIKTTTEATNVQNEVAATPAADRRDELQQWSDNR